MNYQTNGRKSKWREFYGNGRVKEEVPAIHWSKERDEDVLGRLPKVSPLTKGQSLYMEAIKNNSLTFCSGPAGSGKSLLPIAMGAQALREGQTGKVILTRPLVSCGGTMGYLPGPIEEKIAPHMRVFVDVLKEYLPAPLYENFLKENKIEYLPLETMRGATFKNCWVILDEAQNSLYAQLYMLLTRVGDGCKMVVSGDASQIDLPHSLGNPFKEVLRRLFCGKFPKGVGYVEMTSKDIVRSGLVRWVDNRLGPQRENQAYRENSLNVWVEFKCPGCSSRCFFDDGSPQDSSPLIEHVRCWKCIQVVKVPEDWEGQTLEVCENPQGEITQSFPIGG